MRQTKRQLCIVHCALCIAISAHGAEIAATATDAIAVDSREGARAVISPLDIGYSPYWCGIPVCGAYAPGCTATEGSYAVIEKVEHAGMFNAATSPVVTNAPGAEGDYSYAPGAGDAKCVRLVHRVYDAGGAGIGTPLTADVVFGFEAAAAASATADSRDDLLQREAALGKVVGLTYDTAWATNAASVAISAVQTKDGRGNDLAVPATNQLFSAGAEASGAFAKTLKSGGWRFLMTSFDGNGNVICAPYFADYFLKTKGTTVLLQ